MRLFAAVPLAEPAREEIVRVLGRLRGGEWPVRWVGDEVIHITLKFFGEVRDERLDVIAEALQLASAGAGPMTLRLGALGAFPTERRPRILRSKWTWKTLPKSDSNLQTARLAEFT